jgi:hypothetical protein
MRNLILGAATALTLASPAIASDLPVTNYSESYARSYEYRTPPPVVVERPAPVISETIVIRRPVVVAPPRVVVEEYPVYATPRVYAAPPVYAYAGPAWRGGWASLTLRSPAPEARPNRASFGCGVLENRSPEMTPMSPANRPRSCQSACRGG